MNPDPRVVRTFSAAGSVDEAVGAGSAERHVARASVSTPWRLESDVATRRRMHNRGCWRAPGERSRQPRDRRAGERVMAARSEHGPSPTAMMLRLVNGCWVTQAIGVGARLGLADQLADGPKGTDELARAVGADPQALQRLLRMLASLGVFQEVAEGTFGLTALGETLRSDVP